MDDIELRDTVAVYCPVQEVRCFEGPSGFKRGCVEVASMRDAEKIVAELDDRAMAEWHLLLRAFIVAPSQELLHGGKRLGLDLDSSAT